MFVKIRVEDSDKISKVKYNGEDYPSMMKVISSKLNINQQFELYYLDEDKEKIVINDDDDWKLCLENFESLTSSTASAGGLCNVSLFLVMTPGSQETRPNVVTAGVSKSAHFTERPTESQAPPENISNDYPAPPSHHKVTATFQPVQPVVVDQSVKVVSSQVDTRNSTIFGGASSSFVGNAVHLNIVCDECSMNPLTGNRYKSLTQNDFDLCESCSNLPKYAFETFIQIRYYDMKENSDKGIYNAKNYKKVIDIFKNQLAADLSIKEEVDKFQKIFVSDQRSNIEGFLKANKNLTYDLKFREYIKKYHS